MPGTSVEAVESEHAVEAPDEPGGVVFTSEQSRANFRNFVWDVGMFGVAIPATARFLSVYAIRLDASAALLGWMAALPSIIALLTSAAAAWWRARYSDSVKAIRWPSFLYRLVFLLPAFTPLFPTEWQPLWLVLAVSLPALPMGVASVLFLVMLREGVENRQLTALMGRRSLIFNLTVAASTLVMGFWLQRAPFPMNYSVMFAVAYVFGLLSFVSVQRVKVLPIEMPPVQTDVPALKPWQSPGFRRVAFVTIVMHISFFSILPIIPLRLMDDLGANEGYMSIFALAELGAAALMASQTNKLARRIGTLNMIAAGLVLTGVAGLIFSLSSSLTVMLIGSALSGAGWTGAAITGFAFFAENTPADSLTRFSTLYNQIVMLAVFIGPMLGSQLAGTSLSVVTVMLLGSGLRFVAGVLIRLDGVDWGPVMRRRGPRRAAA